MTRDEVIERLCKLTNEVHDKVVGYGHASDCFCGKGGFNISKYHSEADYRNDGQTIEWIENAVRSAIAKELALRGAAL